MYDVIIVGGGHNGLTAAAYMAKEGKKVLIVEARHKIGGAAVSEELYPGFTFSRCSYVCSLLRPTIIKELELKKRGFKLYPRDPSSFTPTLDGRYLLLGSDEKMNHASIAQFSQKDADAYPKYEAMLERLVQFVQPLLDDAPLPTHDIRELVQNFPQLAKTALNAAKLGEDFAKLVEITTAPASVILQRWFESEPLLATLASDSIIGAGVSPNTPGSAYVLLHHIMGETDGKIGVWANVEGGMGAISNALCNAAVEAGTEVLTNAPVEKILVGDDQVAQGVKLKDGRTFTAKSVMVNAHLQHALLDLIDKKSLPTDYRTEISRLDNHGVQTKINIAVDRLPNFTCTKTPAGVVGPEHHGTIHINQDSSASIIKAFKEFENGQCSTEPIVEMTIPSALDPTISPEGKHVVLMFCQYSPYQLANGQQWTDQLREDFADRCFNMVERYAPGFKDSVLYRDILTPRDLESEFGLRGGSIFHTSMGVHNLYWNRPISSSSSYKTPVQNLFLCGAGCHPGGGVMGAAGKNAARVALKALRRGR